MVWLSIVRVGFRQHPSEASVKVSLRVREDLVLVLIGIFWVGLV